MRAHLDRGLIIEGAEPFRKEEGKEDQNLSQELEEEEENSEEEEASDGNEVFLIPVGESEVTGERNLAQSNQTVTHQCEPYLLAIMQQMTQIMSNIQEDSSFEASRQPAFNT
ncbi:hypothetical protein O181_024776 [Austropuccinia psidii MF-1]|uniref:Uncharacterized protein n=1 Tax=Austropuccinia psidii MF-1 TaxID=1389203 RepID=A0A9Q3CM33_9BASI|nr:hypothetical protein [Austropuccinia psidii MF-1]